MVDVASIPTPAQSLVRFVEYHPDWDEEFKLFVDQHNWHYVRPYADRLKVLFPREFGFDILGHPYEERPGIRFGFRDFDTEARLADVLCVPPHRATPEDVVRDLGYEEPERPDSPTWQRRRGRPPGPTAGANMPFAKLKSRGDCFSVTGDVNLQTLRNAASKYGRERGMYISCLSYSGGTLVTLVDGRSIGECAETVVVEPRRS